MDNIVIEPNSSSVEFLLYGKRDGDNAGNGIDMGNAGVTVLKNSTLIPVFWFGAANDDLFAGVLFHLDFAALNQQKCKGIWAADSVSSDYETWSPSGT